MVVLSLSYVDAHAVLVVGLAAPWHLLGPHAMVVGVRLPRWCRMVQFSSVASRLIFAMVEMFGSFPDSLVWKSLVQLRHGNLHGRGRIWLLIASGRVLDELQCRAE